jgi:hypothetical protein
VSVNIVVGSRLLLRSEVLNNIIEVEVMELTEKHVCIKLDSGFERWLPLHELQVLEVLGPRRKILSATVHTVPAGTRMHEPSYPDDRGGVPTGGCGEHDGGR